MSYLSNHPAHRYALALVGLVGLAAPALLLAGGPDAAHAAVPPPAAGWKLEFGDDFSGATGTGLDPANWLYDTGHGYPGGATNWGTNEIETMTNSTNNVYHDGFGNLAIKPIRDAAGNWTSGRVETQRTDLAAPPGGVLIVQARIQQPAVTTANGAGYWPAFWVLGAAARPVGATNWPSIGEWDIMEGVNGRPSTIATFHCGVATGGPCNETTGISSGEHECSGCNGSFHTYAVEYDRSMKPETMRFYLDGINYHSVTYKEGGEKTWADATQHGMFIILNVAMGGKFPTAFGGGPNASTVSGVPMLVDWVAAYTKAGGGATPRDRAPSGLTPTLGAAKPTPTEEEEPEEEEPGPTPGGPTPLGATPAGPTPPGPTPTKGVATGPTPTPRAPTKKKPRCRLGRRCPPGPAVAGATSKSITLAWPAVSGATSYNIRRDGVLVDSSVSPNVTDKELKPKTRYVYSVQAVNKAGASAASPELTATTTG